MTIRKTPRSYDEVRPLYEKAVYSGNKIHQTTIELDNQINNSRQKLIHSTGLDDTITTLETIKHAGIEAVKAMPRDLTANFTDLNRLLSTSTFAVEKATMPLLFGANTRRAQSTREELANGTESKSIEIIEILLNNVLPRFANDTRPGDRERIRGAIQEDTATALLNHRQDGQFIVLPASLEDDVLHGTDLDAYYIAEDGKGYKTPISVKSSKDDAAKERQKHPHLVVISASDFNNQDLAISRLLVRQDEGSPGLSEDEETILNTARQSIYQTFYDQVSKERALAIELPRYPAQWIVTRFEKAAI